MFNSDRFFELAAGAIGRRWLTNDGPLVRELEEKVEEYLGVRHCLAVANGTIALEIAIKALGLTGEVVVPSWTFVATAHALHWHGLRPVFVDIDPETHSLDPDAVRRSITDDTRAIFAVHLWGRPADVDLLEAIAQEHQIPLVFDAAHAFGVSYGARKVGNFGSAEVLSFHATKFFNAIEGGAIVTNDDELAAKVRLMRNFGFAGEDTVVSAGTNGKLNEISAAMALSNFDGIDELIRLNRERYEAYVRGVAGLPGLRILDVGALGESNYQYVVLVVGAGCPVARDDLLHVLRANNVLARRYFWPGVHRMEPYRTIYPDAGANLPHTEDIAQRVIVLPTGMAVSLEDVATIIRLITSAVLGDRVL